MEACADDIANDLHSMSFNSTTTTTATDIHRSTSSGSDWTSSSAPFAPFASTLSLSDLRFLHRLGAGDIGSVYLAELKGAKPPALFAAKVMDKKELASRNKEGRARTERDILEILDHPFLPKLYAAVDSPKWSCLLTEFCPGGDLHVLRQRQPYKRFPDSAVRFYASEVVAALEYIHMMGIVYRDLKPENVLVRSDGHIMLTDFDLSLMCDDSSSTPAQVVVSITQNDDDDDHEFIKAHDAPHASSSCILPSCIVPAMSCFNPKRRRKKWDHHHDITAGPALVAEPIDIRSMSFVGTHEYLAPEIVSGEGHGNAVDWWTLGIFMYELFYGVTPFRGMDHEITLANIIARALDFPKEPAIPSTAKDLISHLLVKDPARRMGSTMGASPIKKHPFFHGVNWALLRCASPPFIPPPFTRSHNNNIINAVSNHDTCTVEYY